MTILPQFKLKFAICQQNGIVLLIIIIFTTVLYVTHIRPICEVRVSVNSEETDGKTLFHFLLLSNLLGDGSCVQIIFVPSNLSIYRCCHIFCYKYEFQFMVGREKNYTEFLHLHLMDIQFYIRLNNESNEIRFVTCNITFDGICIYNNVCSDLLKK